LRLNLAIDIRKSTLNEESLNHIIEKRPTERFKMRRSTLRDKVIKFLSYLSFEILLLKTINKGRTRITRCSSYSNAWVSLLKSYKI
jgi:hypothetical protein